MVLLNSKTLQFQGRGRYLHFPKKKNNNLPEKINNNKYYIILNELAHGDIKQLFTIKTIVDNNSLIYNIFIQVILSILTFHNIGYIHRDCHYGNFLYQRVNDDGYYHYEIYPQSGGAAGRAT